MHPHHPTVFNKIPAQNVKRREKRFEPEVRSKLQKALVLVYHFEKLGLISVFNIKNACKVCDVVP